ncbi:uncharacterized protein (TIGR02284 family) [Chitinophaga skermanii]|uniref:Uncharacterized protein (TIGR02284 family) n=1 Tax=Chitinophaga skermanii TaxID=331697 RepID=A0A327QB14_9BACT|nr:PA2169 family four-helix-bundle protein [Chitinophaga skermanii]RAJ01620.1 uncharacterized protein (TIGR02284 family) [Chitinophaga skermanii]
MENHSKTVSIIEDLVKINNDRIEGYKKAMALNNETDLAALFQQLVEESKMFNVELNKELRELGEPRERDTTFAGKIYRTWMDVKNTLFANASRKSILKDCEYGEDAAKKAYISALEHAEELPGNVVNLITQQQQKQLASHDQVRHLRDLEIVNK